MSVNFDLINFFQNTLVLGSIFTFKFRHVLEMLLTDNYKNKLFQPNTSYIPDNEISIIQSLKNLYDLNPRSILYRVIIKIINTIEYIFINKY